MSGTSGLTVDVLHKRGIFPAARFRPYIIRMCCTVELAPSADCTIEPGKYTLVDSVRLRPHNPRALHTQPTIFTASVGA